MTDVEGKLMLLGFKRQFAPFVEEGSKTHTIRGERTRSARPREICHCYVDPRQKSMRLLGRWPCIQVDQIRIEGYYGVSCDPDFPLRMDVWINGDQLSPDEVNELAWRDGFRTARRCDAWIGMMHFWRTERGKHEQDPVLKFRGVLIHWDFARPL